MLTQLKQIIRNFVLTLVLNSVVNDIMQSGLTTEDQNFLESQLDV